MNLRTPASPRSVGDWMTGAATAVHDRIERLSAGRAWELKIALLASALSLLVATPNWDNVDPDHLNWTAVLDQARHPLEQPEYPPDSHASKISFRLTTAYIGHVLSLGVPGFLVMHALAGIALLFLVTRLGHQLTADRATAALLSFATAFAYAGSVGFAATNATFDAVALAFLAGALASSRYGVVSACVVLACFTDERAVLATGFVTLYHRVRAGSWSSPGVVAAGLGLAGYAALRVLLMVATELETSRGEVGLSRIADEYHALPLGAWSALEGLWIVVVLGAVALWLHRRRLESALLALLVGGILIAGIAVADVTRSIVYVLPAGMVALAALQRESRVWLQRVVLSAAVLSLVSLSYYTDYQGTQLTSTLQHPLPLQVVRWLSG